MAIRDNNAKGGAPKPQKQEEEKGIVAYTVIFCFSTVKWLCISCLTSILISLFCLTFIWPELGSERDRLTLIYESQFLANQLRSDSYIIKTIIETGDSWVWKAPDYVAEAIGAMAALFTEKAYVYADTAVYAGRVFMVRVLILASSFPLAVMNIMGAFLVGLVERDLRRFNLARESSTKFHMLFNNLHVPLIWLMMLYLSWPFTAHPIPFILPGYLLMTALVFVTTAQYKKYF